MEFTLKISFLISFVFLLSTVTPANASPNEDFCQATSTNKCITPFGKVLGQNDGIQAFSNCRSECVKPVPNKIPAKEVGANEDVFTGITWQCVEYARRWWVLERGISFGSIDTADEIYSLKEAKRIKDGAKINLKQESNASVFAPEVGSLLIYKKLPSNPNLQYGHVAVVVGVNLNKGYIDVAEENYNNKPWVAPKEYARRLVVELKDAKYTVYDINYSEFKPGNKENQEKADMILGWINPEI
jgi:CHAP domain